MDDQSPEERYLARLSDVAGRDHPIQTMLRCRDSWTQRVICRLGTGEVCSGGGFNWPLKKFLADMELFDNEGKHIYVIENIGVEWMGILGAAWDLDGTIFLEHAETHEGVPLWDAVMDRERHRHGSELRLLKNNHIEGVLSNLMPSNEAQSGPSHITRRLEDDNKFGWQSTSRISYERVTEDICG